MKNGIYNHYKGKQYLVIDIVTIDKLKFVLYKCLYKNEMSQFWIRPFLNFNEMVNGVHRFEYSGFLQLYNPKLPITAKNSETLKDIIISKI